MSTRDNESYLLTKFLPNGEKRGYFSEIFSIISLVTRVARYKRIRQGMVDSK